jgi:hypothetical protein
MFFSLALGDKWAETKTSKQKHREKKKRKKKWEYL